MTAPIDYGAPVTDFSDYTVRTRTVTMRGHDHPTLADVRRFTAQAAGQGVSDDSEVKLHLYLDSDTWTLTATTSTAVHPPTEAPS